MGMGHTGTAHFKSQGTAIPQLRHYLTIVYQTLILVGKIVYVLLSEGRYSNIPELTSQSYSKFEILYSFHQRTQFKASDNPIYRGEKESKYLDSIAITLNSR